MKDLKPALPTLSYLLLDPQKPFIHRDLSWIQFNDRVLTEARSKSNPLLKRLKFLSIASSNLDEFFMIRFASLVRSISASKVEENKSNLYRVHGTVLESVRKFAVKQARTFEVLRKEAKRKNIFLHMKTPKEDPVFLIGKEIFEKEILPNLIQRNGFSLNSLLDLKNLQLYVYVNSNLQFEVPRKIPNVFAKEIENKFHLFFLDDLLLTYCNLMFPFSEKPGVLRLTRDADFTLDLPDSDTESIPDLIRSNLGTREKGKLVRLQYNGTFPKDFIQEVADSLKLDLRQCIKAPASLCLHGLFSFANNASPRLLKDPELAHPPLRTSIPEPFKKENIQNLFPSLKELDFLLHHPYDSFDAFLNWLEEAARDPNVIQIEQTIYRTDTVSKIVEILKEAAKTKKVRVILELRARFDEMNNLLVAEELSQAGAEVKFGFGSLKLHAKVTLVTRKEEGEIRRYTHLSTGNYNAKTARLYTDISILTGNQEIGEDARHFFDAIFKKEVPTNFKHLVTAPTKLHQKIRSLVKAETEAAKAGKPARIFAKVNALVDEKIIEDLYAASQAGVQIDLVVRGACSLIPGIKGLSDNIRVISIVDRLLEHSRIYYFQNSSVIYLSSADWMPRNFFSRLEIAFPVLDARLYRFITEVVIPAYLEDNVKARRLTNRGTWKSPKATPPHRSQWYFQDLAEGRYKNTPLYDHPFFQRST
jgi:polyphosphate kinase